ncbi:MAG: extracellular solute-binding protein [Alphaproteobacteria bacterium]|nr:extracellular solute-binding protein [Alphaproteobacteria bacterium]
MRRFGLVAVSFISLLSFGHPSFADEYKLLPALAMHGEPKYGEDFKNFDYANPNAPKGGTLKLGATGTFDSLHPFIIRGQPALGLSLGFMSLTYESLMARGWDEPFTLYGLIAKSVEVPDDRSGIIFNLRPEAKWQDGKSITADDVIFSYEALRDHGRPNHRMYYKKVESAEKLDELRVRFLFKRNGDGAIDREMPLIMGLMPILPKHEWEGRDFDQTSLRIPVGSGPYKVSKMEPGRNITYSRDKNYWGQNVPAQKGLHNFDEIRFDYYRDDAISLQAFKSGQYDLRREPDPNKWAVSYDFSAAHDGRVKLESFPHKRTEAINGFILNTRRDLFKDRALREAMGYAFDFGWINRNLFHDLYKRSSSFFPNSELACFGIPEGDELALLKKFSDRLSPEIFSTSVSPPQTDGGEESLRDNLLHAADILKRAGYVMRDGKLYKDMRAVEFEILLSDPVEEKIALQMVRALQRLGISARARTVDSAQYQARLAAFDFDVIVGKWFNSLSPGNEQLLFWGSSAAKQQGSRNYPGIQDPVVDALAAEITAARSRDDLITATRALDRVLMFGRYVIPFYYLGADQIAFWSQLHHPDVTPLYGPIIESWWKNPGF